LWVSGKKVTANSTTSDNEQGALLSGNNDAKRKNQYAPMSVAMTPDHRGAVQSQIKRSLRKSCQTTRCPLFGQNQVARARSPGEK